MGIVNKRQKNLKKYPFQGWGIVPISLNGGGLKAFFQSPITRKATMLNNIIKKIRQIKKHSVSEKNRPISFIIITNKNNPNPGKVKSNQKILFGLAFPCHMLLE